MKFYKLTTMALIALLALLSFQSTANINDAAWYVSIDVDQIENNEIYKALQGKINKSEDNFTVKFEKIPKEISFISLYGSAKGADDATAVIQGDFTQFSINEHILNLIYSHDNMSKSIKESNVNYKNHEIQVLTIDEDNGKDNESKEVYFSQISNRLTIISFKLDEVKNWLNHDYDKHEIINGRLFSVVVDVQSALAHMGMNLNKNTHMMQSEIFKKVTQASASVSEINEDLVIEVALTTTDEASATQIEQVINGLIAMSNLSGNDDQSELHTTLMQNLSIKKNVNNVLINTYASIEDIKKIDMDKQLGVGSSPVKFKVKVDH